jgi:hypothetical protein
MAGKPANPVSPADVLGHLKDTKTGETKLLLISAWINANPQEDADALLRWAEDQIASRLLGEGTVRKMGVRIVGDSYGIRQVGESNSMEIARLREELNAALQREQIANRGAGSRATDVSLMNSRLITLEDENRALRDQIALLRNVEAPVAQKIEQPARTGRKVRTGLQKSTQVAGAMSENVGSLAEATS